MKKLVIATLLAAATGAVSAQTVEVSGYFREFITSTKTGTAGSINGVTADAPSSITFKGTEDLGGGLKARFVLQTGVTADAPTTGADTQLGNFQSTVGFANDLGSIDMGRQKHAYRLVYDAVDPFLVATFSSQNKVHNVQGSRLNNTIYTQVNLGPVIAKYDHGFSETAGTAATKTGTLSTTVLGVTGTVGFYEDDSASKNKGTNASLATTLATGTRIAGVVSRDTTTTTTANAWSVAGVHPVGKVDLKASYGEKDLGGVKAYTVGAAYNFSKRTNIEVAHMKVSADSASNESRVTGVGVNHRF